MEHLVAPIQRQAVPKMDKLISIQSPVSQSQEQTLNRDRDELGSY
jgi:hypothetical protein